MTAAIKRRVAYELGITITNIRCILPNYRYKTPAYRGIIENEVCPVFIVRTKDEPAPNSQEVDDLTWLAWDKFKAEALADKDDIWSWWCKDQLKMMDATMLANYAS